MKKILIIGGAGYIGSHMVKMLLAKGKDVIILDDLSSGHRDAVLGGVFIHGNVGDEAVLDFIFTSHQIDTVMHFASYIQVGESVNKPGLYYKNNVSNTINLLNAMVRHQVPHFVFSSTAAIFGNPQYMPIDEEHPIAPINPYGRSKWMIEQLLQDYEHAHGLRYISLRYFNAAGADPEGMLGERHDPETHLMPLILQAASGRREAISIYGRNYPTVDGTCIRDYIHIMDLCQAHLLALDQLTQGGPSAAYNLGNGNGFSVQQVIDVARKVTGCKIKIIYAPRRDGDPAVLVADSSLAKERLGWIPCHADIETIIQHAWQWECQQVGNHPRATI